MSTRRRRCFLRLATLLFVVLAGACSARGGSGENPFGEGGSDRLEITVDNRNFKDATLYALWNEGSRRRIGRVSGKTEQTFEMSLQGQRLRIQVDFLGGGGYTTVPQDVHPGDHLYLSVDPTA